MKSIKKGDFWIVRLEIGEDVVEQLQLLCEQENITLGTIQGIGAVDKATIGLYDPNKGEYYSKTLEGDYEITSLLGSITNQNGKPYIHLHVTLGDHNYNIFGGHLNLAVVSATCEIFIQTIPGEIGRFKDDESGLNLMEI